MTYYGIYYTIYKKEVKQIKTIIYQTTNTWNYYLYNGITKEFYKITEEEFFQVVGYDRNLIPMHREKQNINKQNFYLDNTIIAYRERK